MVFKRGLTVLELKGIQCDSHYKDGNVPVKRINKKHLNFLKVVFTQAIPFKVGPTTKNVVQYQDVFPYRERSVSNP